jgi:hypothetical protein
MKLTEIVSVAGVPGLHKIVGRTKTGLILESLNETKKRFPTGMQDKVSVLDDISMYTLEGDVKLSMVLKTIHTAGNVPDGKNDTITARKFLVDTIKLDSERVYDSDIKKLINWYHILNGVIDIAELKEDDNDTDEAITDPITKNNIEAAIQTSADENPKKTSRKTAKKTDEPVADNAAEKPKKTTRKKKTEE